jgi:hypothetical protein
VAHVSSFGGGASPSLRCADGGDGVSDWPYRFEILDVNELVVDESYQRPLTSFAKRIERAFYPALVGTLVVSRRDDGTQAVVDGQTRAAAIRTLAGEGKVTSTVPCLVYIGMSQADEASLFVRLQKERRGMHSYERFRAALVAGDAEAVAIKALCDRLGYRIGTDKSREISAVAGLEKVYRRGPKILKRTLLMLRAAWGEEYLPSGDMLRGVGYLLGAWSAQRRATNTAKHTPRRPPRFVSACTSLPESKRR